MANQVRSVTLANANCAHTPSAAFSGSFSTNVAPVGAAAPFIWLVSDLYFSDASTTPGKISFYNPSAIGNGTIAAETSTSPVDPAGTRSVTLAPTRIIVAVKSAGTTDASTVTLKCTVDSTDIIAASRFASDTAGAVNIFSPIGVTASGGTGGTTNTQIKPTSTFSVTFGAGSLIANVRIMVEAVPLFA